MIKKILSFLQKLVFSKVGDHIKPGSFKRTMDVAFVLFEKIAFAFEDLSTNYTNVYKQIVENELELLDNYSLKNILVIGSGSIPSTPILISKKSNAHVVCIDIDEHAIKKSNTLIKNRGLTHKIEIKPGDGNHISLEGYDAIFILYGMKSQRKILNYLSENLPRNVPVILRVVPQNDLALIDNEPYDLSTNFNVINKKRSHSWGLLDSYLLESKSTEGLSKEK